MAFLEWQNLIFLLPMLAAILYILLMTVGFWVGHRGHRCRTRRFWRCRT